MPIVELPSTVQDTHERRNHMTNAAPQPFAINRDEAKSYWQIGNLWSVLASAQSTGNALTVVDQLMPKRSGPPLHIHERWHEFFYLLDGEIRFQVDDQLLTGSTGTLLSIPPGTPHSFAVVSETTRVLNIYTPGGFEVMVESLGTPATALTLPPEGTEAPPTDEQRSAFTRRAIELESQRGVDDVEDLLAQERAPLGPH